MNDKDISLIAKAHTRLMKTIAANHAAISKEIIRARGSYSGVAPGEVMAALAQVSGVSKEDRHAASEIAGFAAKMPAALDKLTSDDRRVLSAIEGSVYGKSVDDAIASLTKLIPVAPEDGTARIILRIAAAVLEDGKDSLYSPRGFGDLVGLPSGVDAQTVQSSIGGFILEDVAGAAVGGAAGAAGGFAITWWSGPGAGPGTAGGAVGGAASGTVMFSGKYLWEAGKQWWDGTYHGETDPVGPIGGEGLPRP